MAISEPTALDVRIHRRAALTLEVMAHLLTQQPPGLNPYQRAQWLLKSRTAGAALGAAAVQLKQTPPQASASWVTCIQRTLMDAGDSGLDDNEFQARLAERLTEMLEHGDSHDTTIEQSGSPAQISTPGI